ncbi:MAG: adenylate/guanylate cyclase domain-containing protein [Bacteroidales bacterium]
MESASKDQLLRRIARLVRQNKELEEQVKKLEREKERLLETTEKYRLLVENNELKGVRVAEEEKSLKFNMVTVLFADIQGFTGLTEGMDPGVVMDELDEIFFEFDRIIRKYHIEKIRTIGDTYMCAGGIPAKTSPTRWRW